MTYKVIYDSETDRSRANEVLEKADGYLADCIRSLKREDIIEPVTGSEEPDMNIVFTSEYPSFERFRSQAKWRRDPGAAASDNTICVSLPHFKKHWDDNAGYHDLVARDLKPLGLADDEDIMTEHISICVADLMVRFLLSL